MKPLSIGKLGILILIISIACIVRLWHLESPDITPDEDHYVIEARRLANKDPNISIRHHPFKHPGPSIGHPFFAQILTATTFNIFGFSVYSSRLPAAISGVLSVVLLFLLNRELGGKVKYLAALMLSIMPLAVRYTRNAQIDSVFALTLTLAAVSVWRYLSGKNKVWLIIAGVGAALSISTKLDGIIGLVMVVMMLTICKDNFRPIKTYLKQLAIELAYLLIPLGLVSFLLNDPSAYIDGIINPSFTQWKFTSMEFWINRLSLKSMFAFIKVLLDLLSPVVIIALILSMVFSLKRIFDFTDRFLMLWLVCVSGVFFVHGFTVDSSYGWVPVTAPAALLVSYWISRLKFKYKHTIVWLILALTLPYTFIYGFKLRPLPTHGTAYALVYNRTLSDNFYQEIVERINTLTPINGSVFLLPQANYPIFALRPDIKWTYSLADFDKFDVLVVDKVELVAPQRQNVSFLETKEAFQDGETILRYIFVRR